MFLIILSNFRIIPGDEVARHFPTPIRPTVYKQRTNSPTPKVTVTGHDAPERASINEDLSAIRGKLNPVKELQMMIGRQSSTNEEVKYSSS